MLCDSQPVLGIFRDISPIRNSGFHLFLTVISYSYWPSWPLDGCPREGIFYLFSSGNGLGCCTRVQALQELMVRDSSDTGRHEEGRERHWSLVTRSPGPLFLNPCCLCNFCCVCLSLIDCVLREGGDHVCRSLLKTPSA